MGDVGALLPQSISGGQIAIIAAALLLSGIIKGATGAGAPIVAVPVMAAIVDVRFAILTMLMPNLWTNIWQAYHFRGQRPDGHFLWPLVGGGAAGILVGTFLLATLSLDALSMLIGSSVLAYILFRLAKPGWVLPFTLGRRLSFPAGFASGVLQGATGLAAPVLLTFLSAMRLPRLTFVATVSLLFVTFTVTHLAGLAAAGILTLPAMMISLGALVPISFGMTIGNRLLHRVSPKAFDGLVLSLLTVIAVRIFYQAFFGG